MAAPHLTVTGLRSQILKPEDAQYKERIESYFDSSAKLYPNCIVQPRTAAEVAEAVKALASAGQEFAIRSGGCGNRAGSNHIDGGTKLASLGPGANWGHVYNELEKYGRVVAGGRVDNVGVGGLLLGGGLSFYSGRDGFACDSVMAYQVVLADGSIVTAKVGEHEDLFRVLKGGSNNFGIVTPANALESFSANTREDPDSTTIFVAGHQPRFGGDVIMTLCFNVAGVEKPKAFDGFFSLPELFSDYKTGKITDLTPYSALPASYYNIWYTVSFKNDASIIQKASELHCVLAKELKEKVTYGDFTSHCAFQPIPLLYSQHSVAAGGNIMGIEAYPHDGIMLQVSASVKTAELAEWVRPKVRAITQDLTAFASTVKDGIMPWQHLNYAAADQQPLQSYGAGNVAKMRGAAIKYDPNGVFQRLCPGEFKITAVKD
ncbi:hypothetical protein N0V93_008208 [Gnomoniopsis smithogilvyi]|uniref:FAD linked oxidase N-terminal domain-containing protein n=1 Tax=Gnomoniopsis smithogilvyi TaxID=1191159 RepID=A0A9W8YPW7_9PEZI|nr:hypothetical protein N0V93_008208 [Gnomoniopsis smithogilvyi]